jgi:aspartyl-tRNA(Asn)/glutamyl-tRNA(Gln) amidotransferase subunit A
VTGLRVGVAEGLLFDDLDPDVEHAVRDCEDVFRDLGARVSRVGFDEADEVMAIPSMISVVEGYAVNASFVEQQAEMMDPVVLSRMRPGGSVSAVEYRRQLDALGPLRLRAERRFDTVDVLIGPTSPIAAAPAAEVDADAETYLGYARRYLRNCFVGNLLNLCAVSVPCGFTRAGLPIGLMIYARAFAEDTALRVARAFERSTVWHRERPDLSWARR